MFRHYRVILKKLVISTSPSYVSISNVAVGITVKIKKFQTGFMQVLSIVVEISILQNL